MKRGLQQKIVVGFWAAIITLGAVGGASISNVVNIVARSSRASQNREAIAELNRLWGLVAATDSAARYHLLRRTPDSLASYQVTQVGIRASLEVLRQTLSRRELSRWRDLDSAVLARLALHDQAIHAQDSESVRSLETRLAALDPAIRGEIAEITAMERDGLTAQVTRTTVIWFFTMAGITATCLIAMLGMAWAASLVRREMRDRDLAPTKERQARAEQANRSKDEFLAMMSHDLRTPLTVVIGFADLLIGRHYGALNERQDSFVRDIQTAGHRLMRLINDILDLSKVEAGRLELCPEDLPLGVAIGNALNSLDSLADQKSIVLQRVCPAEAVVRADARRLQQVLTNLIGNAIKFTPEHGRVVVAARQERAFVQVDVIDNGPGIARQEQELIFGYFYRALQTHSREGTGLGLTITKRFVEAMGGTLGLESVEGKGSRFFFTLPASQPLRGVEPAKVRLSGQASQ